MAGPFSVLNSLLSVARVMITDVFALRRGVCLDLGLKQKKITDSKAKGRPGRGG